MSARRRSKELADGNPPRVVLDTNVVLSALVFGQGTMARLRVPWQGGQCVPLVSTATAQELVRVLGYPEFRLDPAAQRELLADYLPYAEVVRIPKPLPIVPACRDVFDLPFLRLAVAGRADILVSGDADLLALADLVRFGIMTPEIFLKHLPPIDSSGT
ncbi:MAG: putative toxin-antitoxin system toxin component, PIN family [Burkholderiaceae bacterium]|nr:putative toxin-antitoxin system toxin component, PIN family [Burkholderiaceae bacterium]